jgi:hypothetical protein
MRNVLPLVGLLLTTPVLFAAPAPSASSWQGKVTRELPLLGHRNWILIVDSAYPLQSNPGIETIETNTDQIDVVRYVLGAIGNSIHVRPDILMDAELSYVPESDAPGVSAYRAQIGKLLAGHYIKPVPHEKLIASVDDAAKMVHILVLKTRLAVPYTSVFIRLNCRYWSDGAEKRLRARMPPDASASH